MLASRAMFIRLLLRLFIEKKTTGDFCISIPASIFPQPREPTSGVSEVTVLA